MGFCRFLPSLSSAFSFLTSSPALRVDGLRRVEAAVALGRVGELAGARALLQQVRCNARIAGAREGAFKDTVAPVTHCQALLRARGARGARGGCRGGCGGEQELLAALGAVRLAHAAAGGVAAEDVVVGAVLAAPTIKRAGHWNVGGLTSHEGSVGAAAKALAEPRASVATRVVLEKAMLNYSCGCCSLLELCLVRGGRV